MVTNNPLLHLSKFCFTPIEVLDMRCFSPIILPRRSVYRRSRIAICGRLLRWGCIYKIEQRCALALYQSQIFGTFAKGCNKPLNKIRSGKRFSSFPSTNSFGVAVNFASYICLCPAALFTFTFQFAVWGLFVFHQISSVSRVINGLL